MLSSATEHGLTILMVLLLLAASVGLAINWIKVPYSIALVIVGLLVGSSHIMPQVNMSPEMVLFIFLPALLFEAAFNINLKELVRNWLAVFILSVPGVLVSTLATGYILHLVTGFDLSLSFLFGAITAATDPISVLALFRKLGLDKRLTAILEGESLLNDGTAVVLFKLMLAIIISGVAPQVVPTTGQFALVVIGGALLGIAGGCLASFVTRFFDDHLMEITLTAILAYGIFLIAEELHVSPVIAVVAAGIVLGNYGAYNNMSARTRLAVNSFWEYAAFVVNSIVFLLIGLEIDFGALRSHAGLIAAGVISLLAARMVVTYGLMPLVNAVNRKDSLKISLKWQHLLFWAALRGSLSMALALSLPMTFPEREKLIVLVFGVVLFTLIVPGLSIEPLTHLLKIEQEDKNHEQIERLRSLVLGEKKALTALEKRASQIDARLVDEIRGEIVTKTRALESELNALITHVDDQLPGERALRKDLYMVRKRAILSMIHEHDVDSHAVESVLVDIEGKVHAINED